VSAVERRPLGGWRSGGCCYTLQVGREADEARLGVIVARWRSFREAAELSFWRGWIEGLIVGSEAREGRALAAFAPTRTWRKAIEAVVRGQARNFWTCWVKGLSLIGAGFTASQAERISCRRSRCAGALLGADAGVGGVGPGVPAAGPQLPAAFLVSEALPSH